MEAIVSCGDLPFEYLEYVLASASVPLYSETRNESVTKDGILKRRGRKPPNIYG